MVLAWVALMACILTYTVHWEIDHGHPTWDRPEYRAAMTTVGLPDVNNQTLTYLRPHRRALHTHCAITVLNPYADSFCSQCR